MRGPARRRRPAHVAGALLLAAALGTGAASCAGGDLTGTPSARVQSWVVDGGGGTAIGTLRADVTNVDQALARHNAPAAIRTVCALLSTDANRAMGSLPTPDGPLTAALERAYTDAASAGDHCERGAGASAALMAQSARERTALGPLLDAAVARIEAVTGRTPSTATTAPPPGGDPFGGGGA
jgi:hypothetical protein